MKNTISVITLAFISLVYSGVFAQGYYYQGRYISLQERNNGIAIVTKSFYTDTNQIINNITAELPGDAYIKAITGNFVYVKFENEKSAGEIANIKNSLSSRINNIKFITSVYYGESRQVTQIPTDEFIVKLRNKNDSLKLDILNLQNFVVKYGVVDDGRAIILKTTDLSTQNALELINIYFQSGIFEYAEPNFLIPAEGFFNWTPNDTYYPIQWPLNNTGGQLVNTGGYSSYGDSIKSSGFSDADMDVDLAWNYVKGNQNVIVAVFDTGVDSLHPDLAGNLTTGYNAYSNNNTVTTDPGSHGTCTIGIIGARTNNAVGISGIAGGDNGSGHCKIASYRLVTDAGSFTTDANIARAFDTARVRGVYISSNSWGGGTPSTTLMNAINNCAINGRGGLGCVIMFSSGNDGRNPPNYPSYLSNVTCVGASTSIDSKKSPGTGDQFWWGGCYGEDSNGDLDLVAPTITITTDERGSAGYTTTDYDSTFNGTSCSCPHAAGVAALIFSVNPGLTRNQVLDYLYRGCDKIENIPYSIDKSYGKWNHYMGYGRVNAYNSVRLAAGVDITPPTVNHVNTVSSVSTYPFIISAEIVDQDGSPVPNTGINIPVLYYRKNKNNTGWSVFTGTPAYNNSANVFYFKVPCSGWQTEIEYYISAKDNAGNESLFPKNAPNYPCYSAVGTTSVESGKFTTFTLPSSGVAISPSLNMPEYKILEADITLYLRHTYVSDFNLSLWSPSTDTKRNRVCLFSENGEAGDNIIGSNVSDNGTYFWREVSPPYTNLSIKPDHNLSGFLGTSSGGNWKLLYYDGYSGDGGTFDSASLNIKRLTGTVSPCARLDFPSDSISFFTDSTSAYDTVDFYLRNAGNSALTISSYNFSGIYAANFSIINTPPASIAINDSGLFRIMLSNILIRLNEKELTDATERALLNINNNDPSKPVFKVSLQSGEPSVTDTTGPNITYTPLTNISSTLNRVLTGFAAITDGGSGVDTSLNKPRLYYKKSTNDNAFLGNNSTSNGWKWVVSSNTASPFDFTIDYSLLFNDGAVTTGTVIQYFVVAQDMAVPVNVSSNPSFGFAGTSVSSISSAPAYPNYFVIVHGSPLAGDYTVGLAKFNEITGLKLYAEKFTRKVTKQVKNVIPGKNSAKNPTSKSSSESVEDAEDKTDKKTNRDILINDRTKDNKIFGNNSNSRNEQSRFKTIEYNEDYYVIMEDDKPYEGPLFVSLQDNYNKTDDNKFTGVYATITAAIEDMRTNGVADQVRFLLTDENYDYEIFPLYIDSISGVNDTNTVTIKPFAGITPVISCSEPSALFYLDNAEHIIIDGSNTNGGSTKDMTLVNSDTNGVVILLMNDSKYNTIKNDTLKSGSALATVLFYTTSGTDGNDYNTVSNCDIRNISETVISYTGILSWGDTVNTGVMNSYNSISGNNISNFIYSGVWLYEGSGDRWIIKNNSFFRNLSSAPTDVTVAIQISTASSNADSIVSNYIGGSAPFCGGGYWINNSKNSLYGMYIYSGTAYRTFVKGNTIQNIALTDTDTTGLSGGYVFGIYGTTSGNLEIYGNTIGHPATANSITSAGTGGIRGITTYCPASIKNNLIANITNTNPATDSISNYYGIQVYYDLPDTIAYNKIYNVGPANPSARTSYIPAGIMLRNGSSTTVYTYVIFNNMITMGDGFNNNINHCGIWDYASYTKAQIFYNSIYIGGSASFVGTNAYYKQSSGTGTTALLNNVIYNNRTGGARQYAYYFVSYTNVVSNYNNLYSISDTCIYYGGARTFRDYVTASGMDKQSLSGNPAYTSTTNLLPNAANENSWDVNGKGTQTWISDDFLGNPRSVTVPNGPTDFGAYEITPTVAPPTMIQTGTIGVGNTTSYAQSLKTYLDITWGASADNTRGITRETVSNVRGNNNLRTSPQRITDYPATVVVKKYSGIDPPDVTGILSPQRSKGYWYVDTDADPGSPVTVKVYWGYEELGNISDTSKLILAMYDMKNRAWVPFYRGTGDGFSVVDHANKTITVSGLTRLDSVCYALTSSDAPLKRFVLDLTLLIEGLYYDGGNPPNMVADTVTAELRQPGTYTLIETMTIPLDQYGKGYGYTASTLAVTDSLFWIVIKHRNALETWCDTVNVKPMFSRVIGTAVYDFTSAQSQVFGGNMRLKNGKWCLYSGDVTKDGFIDGADMALLDIDLYNYVSGWVLTDLTGDMFVDGADMAILDVNLYNYIGTIKPDSAPGYMKAINKIKKIIKDNKVIK